MRLGYLTPLTVKTISNAKRLGYDAVEVGARWVDRPLLDEVIADLPALKEALGEHEIAVTSVAIYGRTIDAPRDQAIAHYRKAIQLTRELDCSVVSGMTGRDNGLSIEHNLPRFADYFREIAQIAEDVGVRIAFEPYPGGVLGHGPYVWQNMATTPELWDRLFEVVPSPALGLEYDPSHLVWQGIDYLAAIRDYGDRIYHVHAKDILIDSERLKRVGVHGRGWWRFVIPGLGQLDWPGIFAALKDAGYDGDMALEHEDQQYYEDRWNEGLTIGLKALRPLVEAYP